MNSKKKLTSVVSYPERGNEFGGNNNYRGNCSPKLIIDLIEHYKINQICDYMCGSNSTEGAAKTTGISSKTYDLHSGFDLLNHNIPQRSEFTFWHPPYFDIVKYSGVMYNAEQVQHQYGYDPKKSDLSRIPTWDKFVNALNYCMMKQFCALDKGGRMAVLVGDIKKRGKLLSMIFEIAKPGKMENVIIKTQHNCHSDNTQYSGNFIPILHEYLLIIRKDAPLLYPVLITKTQNMDIRDMPAAIWRDVVADAMADFRGEVNLEQLYDKIKHYKRAKMTHWQEKVRQTLYVYKDVFHSPRRGIWMLKNSV